MRGKPIARSEQSLHTRITPAHAGKTRFPSVRMCFAGDHPRACGENPVLHDFRAVSTGSPPRMRGKPFVCFHFRAFLGITPAHAGKTLSDVDRDGNKKDHPRACGENQTMTKFLKRKAGSPPRMRGKRAPTAVTVAGQGITPAHAGKTAFGYIPQAAARDHPRACGENRRFG